MPGGSKARPILFYAVLMAVPIAVLLAVYSYYTFSAFNRLHRSIDESVTPAAQRELDEVMRGILVQAHESARLFSAWPEVARQLEVSQSYPEWRKQRMLQAGILPDYAIDAEVYNRDGAVLAKRKAAQLPSQLDLPPPSHVVEFRGGMPYLLVFETVERAAGNAPPSGYVALLVSVAERLQAGQPFRYIESGTIRFSQHAGGPVRWDALMESALFNTQHNLLADEMDSLLHRTVRYLVILFVVFIMLLIPAVILLVVRPLRSISAHIDCLHHGPAQPCLESLAGVLPVAETEKIRESLNEYQQRLAVANSNLERTSKELRTLAHHDALTGALNRRAFDEYLQNMPGVLSERRISVCFALFDVNHFKAINDTYGHQTGDQILKLIAMRISSVLRRGEQLFRLGGDEFAVIMLEADEAGTLRLAERCLQEINAEDFMALGVHEPVKVCVGIAGASFDDHESLASLQWRADIAMYNAKRPGNASIAVFRQEMAKSHQGVFSSRVNSAVYESIILGTGLVMFYQPIVDLETGKVLYCEALVRIRHDNEWITPAVIFPVVEARRLEVELDQAVLKKVLADLRAGKVQRGSGVSINLSGPTIINENLPEWLAAFRPLLSDYRIVLEVTETALITQVAVASENLSRLRDQGFEIALDDFGSGYSSLRYLGSMPVDTVKFDISLIRRLGDDTLRRIVEHLVSMISEIGHRMVAEGIEDEETLEAVRQAGFTLGQGYFFGQPSETAWRSDFDIDNVYFLSGSGGRAGMPGQY